MTSKIYVGLDIGQNNAKVCYGTISGSPKVLMFENQQYQMPVVTALNQSSEVVSVGFDAYRMLADKHSSLTIQVDLKDRTLAGDQQALLAFTELVKKLSQQLAGVFDVRYLNDGEFITIISDSESQSFKDIVNHAGFPNIIQTNHYEAAILCYGAEGLLTIYKNENCRVLVADFSDEYVRLAVLEWSPIEQKFSLLKEQNIPWQENKIDENLLETYILPSTESDKPQTEEQRIILLHIARELKHELSAKFNRGSSHASFNTHSFGQGILRSHHIEISKVVFGNKIAVEPIKNLIQVLNRACKDEALFLDIDHVLLVGGAANWYFVQLIANDIWGKQKVLKIERPELAIAQGLVLFGANYRLTPIDKPAPSEPIIDVKPTIITPIEEVDEGSEKITIEETATLSKKAKTTIITAAFIGAIVSLILTLIVIPGIASFLLIGLEFWMIRKISQIYDKKLTGGLQWFILIVLLLMSFAIKGAIEFLLTAGVVTCIFKPIVSAIVIWGIGELAIYVFKNDILNRYRS